MIFLYFIKVQKTLSEQLKLVQYLNEKLIGLRKHIMWSYNDGM